jgi:thioredoxin 1
MATEIIGKEMFDAHIAASDKLVLVDFWAERCGPCRMLKPVLHEITDARDDVELLTINVDAAENGDLSMEYSVRSIPQVTMIK